VNISNESLLVKGFKQAEMKLFVSCKLDDLPTFLSKAQQMIADMKSLYDTRDFFDLDHMSISDMQNISRNSAEWIITRLYDETMKVDKKDQELNPLDTRVSEKAISILTRLSKDCAETETMQMYAKSTLEKYKECTDENNKINWDQVDLLITAFKKLQDCSESMCLAYLGCL
jgi:hypothetical protein